MKELLDFLNFGPVLLEVLIALVPLLVIFIIFQVFFLRLPRESISVIVRGIVLTLLGLILFLQGVQVGFLPVGSEVGRLLGDLTFRWLIVPLGFCFGLVATLAEPAVRIMSYEVERVSSGAIPSRIIILFLSLGVAIFVALGMVRILTGLSIYYFIIPGYLAAMVMLKFSDPTFTAIAFDSGGVATGPMTVTFVMAMAVGLAGAMDNRDPVLDGFGLIALVALAPIISIMTFGLIYSARKRRKP